MLVKSSTHCPLLIYFSVALSISHLSLLTPLRLETRPAYPFTEAGARISRLQQIQTPMFTERQLQSPAGPHRQDMLNVPLGRRFVPDLVRQTPTDALSNVQRVNKVPMFDKLSMDRTQDSIKKVTEKIQTAVRRNINNVYMSDKHKENNRDDGMMASSLYHLGFKHNSQQNMQPEKRVITCQGWGASCSPTVRHGGESSSGSSARPPLPQHTKPHSSHPSSSGSSHRPKHFQPFFPIISGGSWGPSGKKRGAVTAR